MHSTTHTSMHSSSTGMHIFTHYETRPLSLYKYDNKAISLKDGVPQSNPYLYSHTALAF